MRRDACDISWKILRDAHEILSGENKKKWHQEFHLDTEDYPKLRVAVLNNLLKGGKRLAIAGYKAEAVEEITRELTVLLGVLTMFEAKLEEAKKKKIHFF